MNKQLIVNKLQEIVSKKNVITNQNDLDKYHLIKYYYQKAFYVAPYWWKNIFYFIMIKLGEKIGLSFIDFIRKMKNPIMPSMMAPMIARRTGPKLRSA